MYNAAYLLGRRATAPIHPYPPALLSLRLYRHRSHHASPIMAVAALFHSSHTSDLRGSRRATRPEQRPAITDEVWDGLWVLADD
jgi:hypothetical protein